MLKYAYLLSFLGCFYTGFSQQSGTLDSPLKIPIHASGNFGELRGSHFHAGLDIKTQQREGIAVYAPMDGYVSRIKVSTWGYGKALYIAHPNGLTTVYGHLSAYAGDIAQAVLDKHYNSSAFEIEMFPAKNALKVKKGDLIAYTGNSGGSGGPHLHYEVRDSGTQEILNPLAYGMKDLLVDTKAPTVNGVYVYSLDESSALTQQNPPTKLTLTPKGSNAYTSQEVSASHSIGIGVDMFDRADFNTNKNGVYKVEVFAQDKRVFAYVFDRFSFAQTGFVNVLTDYGYDKVNRTKVQKLFVEVPYGLSVVTTDNNQGIIPIHTLGDVQCRVVLSDFYENKTIIDIPVRFDQSSKPASVQVSKTPFEVLPKKAHAFNVGFASVQIPTNSVYQQLYLDLRVDDATFYFHKDRVAALKNMTLSFETSGMDVNNKEKAFIALVRDNGSVVYNQTSKKGAIYSISTKTFGTYKLAYDTTAPTVSSPSFTEGQWISSAQTMSFSIADDLSGIKSYKGMLNGKWILFDYDYKTRKITYKFSDNKSISGRNDLVIEVIDNMNNKTVFQTHFFRKQ